MMRESHPGWMKIWVGALLVAASACNCGSKSTRDGGTQVDAGFDAGFDSGTVTPVDAGTDAGEVDAGPPPELKILKVLPPRGPSAGGTLVTLQGSGFLRPFARTGSEAKPVTTLKFGQNNVIDYTIIDDETLELRLPPGVQGQATVRITNPLGTFFCNNCFTYFDELSLAKVSPTEGPQRGGGEMTLEGEGFTSDVHVLIDGQASPSITLESSTRLKAVIPRGKIADFVDVRIYNKNGVGLLRRGYRYFQDLRITQLWPPNAALAGAVPVVITGRGFTGATSVKFGELAATGLSVLSDTQLQVTVPAATVVGAVDVTIETPRDRWVAVKAFAYFDGAGAFAIHSIFPHVANAGEKVLLLGQALDTGTLDVTIGGQVATVGVRTFFAAEVTIPARGGAPRKSAVVANSVNCPQTFTYRVGLSAISPTEGPSQGGTKVNADGNAFPASALVAVGALDATEVTVADESHLSLMTPKGSGGSPNDVWIREVGDPENEAVLLDAFTFNEPLALGRVQPFRGSIAGNMLVTVFGAGFGVGNSTGTLVKFGDVVAKDIKVIDPHTITCRTPKGEVGTVDVTVERLGPSDVLAGGFSYFDPRSISGGLSGGPLVGTLNLTVLDSTDGFFGAPVPLAEVILGTDTSTPFQGRTDGRGQVTFSDPALVKALTVTVYKENYETITVTQVNAENLTVFIARTGGGDPNPTPPPPGVPPSVISGRVTGFKAPRVLSKNESLEARVFVAQTSLFGGAPFFLPFRASQEKWHITEDGGEYFVFTRAGLHAVYAVMGIVDSSTKTFTPYLMGVKRRVTTSSESPATGQIIVLDTYIDVNVPVTIDGPLTVGGAAATNNVYAWLDLGAEGFVPNPHNWATGMSTQTTCTGKMPMLTCPGFPQLDGSNFVFMNYALGDGPNDPYSIFFRRQPGVLSQGITIGPMLPAPEIIKPVGKLDGTLSWRLPLGPTADILQVNILYVTPLGALTVWSVILPGNETQVVLPPPALQKLRDEYAGMQLTLQILASKSPKFAYHQWTYDSLSQVSWSSFTISQSEAFLP